MNTLRLTVLIALLAALTAVVSAQSDSDETARVRKAAEVLDEIMAARDSSIPTSILSKAEAIVVFPSTIKGAFIVGAQRGRGVISVREKGTWSNPAFLTITGGSFGLQIGGQELDIVLVVMNRKGLENLLQNQFEIGGEASAAAGPVGRDTSASTDIQFRAEMLSYSRSRGLFAGVSLRGASIRQDQDANERFYGSRFRTRDVVLDGKAVKPLSADAVTNWQQALAKYAPAK
jgi:lipid-binding SYLF domain-containing protein